MILHEMISSHANYNSWANERLMHWLLLQDESSLNTETISSFSTINFTIQHMLRTQRFWLAFVSNQHIKQFDWSLRKDDVQIIIDDFIQQSKEMEMAFKAFSEDELITKLSLDMPWAKNQLPRYEYILHVINHSTFHRGQIVTMARTLGLNQGIPATDYNIFNCTK